MMTFKPLKLVPQLSIKFILLINVVMPTISGILAFINRIICTTPKHFKQENLLIFLCFSFDEQLKCHIIRWVGHEKSFITKPEALKPFSWSTQLSIKMIMLIRTVGILTFISMINTTSESLKQEKSLSFSILAFKGSWNFMLSWVEHEKSFITRLSLVT